MEKIRAAVKRASVKIIPAVVISVVYLILFLIATSPLTWVLYSVRADQKPQEAYLRTATCEFEPLVNFIRTKGFLINKGAEIQYNFDYDEEWHLSLVIANTSQVSEIKVWVRDRAGLTWWHPEHCFRYQITPDRVGLTFATVEDNREFFGGMKLTFEKFLTTVKKGG